MSDFILYENILLDDVPFFKYISACIRYITLSVSYALFEEFNMLINGISSSSLYNSNSFLWAYRQSQLRLNSQFQQLDIDKNKQIDQSELDTFKTSVTDKIDESFDSLDTNDDGIVDQSEYQAHSDAIQRKHLQETILNTLFNAVNSPISFNNESIYQTLFDALNSDDSENSIFDDSFFYNLQRYSALNYGSLSGLFLDLNG